MRIEGNRISVPQGTVYAVIIFESEDVVMRDRTMAAIKFLDEKGTVLKE